MQLKIKEQTIHSQVLDAAFFHLTFQLLLSGVHLVLLGILFQWAEVSKNTDEIAKVHDISVASRLL